VTFSHAPSRLSSGSVCGLAKAYMMFLRPVYEWDGKEVIHDAEFFQHLRTF
jgi:hypothetical protein